MSYFEHLPAVRYEGPHTDNPFAYRHYDKDKLVLGKRMEDHLRLAVCYWHTFVWPGADMFGPGTFERPWHRSGDPLEKAHAKADHRASQQPYTHAFSPAPAEARSKSEDAF